MNPGPPLEGNVGTAISGFLASLGLLSSTTRTDVESQVESLLAAQGHHARVASLRYGTLILETDPVTAKLLSYDQQRLLAAIDDVAPDSVSKLVIHVIHRSRG